jgi:hypothetical protein
MPHPSRNKKLTQEKEKFSLEDPPFVSKFSYGWIAFPYSGPYSGSGESQILIFLQKNNIPLQDHTVFQVFDWNCELLQEGNTWIIKSNGKIVLRRCILSSHKCKECSKVYFLPLPFRDWWEPEQANFCYTCRQKPIKIDENSL